MPKQTPSAGGHSTAIRTLSIPTSGMERVTLAQGQNLEFTFDPGSVSFSRTGTDLVVSGNNGAGLTLQDFFVAENAGALPQFILPGGDTVPSASYLQSLNVDIATAAGPAPATPPSSGEGQYADGAGNLLDGVDRLGSLGTDQWSGAMKAAEVHVDSDRGGLAVALAGGPDVPPVNPPAPDIVRFNARAVLYMQNEGDAPNGQPYDTRGVTVQALAKDGNGVWEASGQEASAISLIHDKSLPLEDYIEYEQDADGNITFHLTAAGRDWMAANGKDMAAYYMIMDAAGNMYTLQVVISADQVFNSSTEHNGILDPGGLIHGEWHDGKDLTHETDYKTTSSNLSDDLRYTGKLTGAEINTGYAADKNWGNDSVTIEGEVHRSSITSGAGDDSIVISGGGEYDRSVGGEFASDAWADRAWSGRSKEEAGGATVWGGTIDAGDGNNTIQISGGAMYGIMDTTITTGSGDDLIEIRGGSTHDKMTAANGRDVYFGGNAVKDSVINAGDGNNTITITSDYPFVPWASSNDTIGGYSMAAVNNSKIITGSGNDSITVNATVFTFSPSEVIRDNALYATTIAAGAGSDTVTINGDLNWGNVIALGNTTDRADTDESQKNDVNQLILNSTEVWQSAIYGSAGKDIITGGAQFSRMTIATGAGSDSVTTYGNVQDSTIALGNTLDRADTGQEQKGDINSLYIGSEVARSSIYGTAGQDNIRIGRDVYDTTIATGAGSDNVYIGSALEASTVALGNTTEQADTDADQQYDVNTLRVGNVIGSKVYGTAGTELINIDGAVNGSTIDTGSGAGDRVDIRRGVFSNNAADNNLIKAVDGSITVKAEDAGGRAVSANGANARNTIIGNTVDITAEGATSAYGVYAKGNGAANNVSGGELTVTAKGPSAYGVYTEDAGASTTVNMSGDVNITAAGNNALGVYAKGGAVDITGKDVTIAANGNTSGAWARGLQSSGGTIALHSKGGTVQIDAHGKEAYAMSAEGGNGSSVLIEGAKKVTLNADTTGMNANSGNARNTIDGGEVHIAVDGATPNSSHIGMHADEAKNIIQNASSVIIEALKGGTESIAMSASGQNGKNSIEAGSLHIDAQAGDSAVGMYALTDGLNTATVAGRAQIDVTGGSAYGMGANFTNAENSLAAAQVDITATATGPYGSAGGLSANMTGKNTIEAAGDVRITAQDGFNNRGVLTMQGTNDITGAGVTITAKGNATSNSATAMDAGDGFSYGTRGLNSIHDVAGKVTLSASGGENAAYGSSSANAGMAASSGSQNHILNVGSVEITAKDHKYANYGMEGGNYQLNRSGDMAENLISGVAGTVEVNALGGKDARGMTADMGSRNIIEDAAGVSVAAKAAADGTAYGMNTGNLYSSSNSTRGNIIRDVDGPVQVSATGNTATAMNILGDGVNTIENAGSVKLTATASAGGTAGAMQATDATGYTSTAKNSITGVDGDVTLSATGGDKNYGMNAVTNSVYNHSENVIEDVNGKVALDAKGGRESVGMSASGENAKNTVSNAGSVDIKATGGDTANVGLNAGEFGNNLIDGVAGNVTILADGKNGSTNTGLLAQNSGTNTISDVDGLTRITATTQLGSTATVTAAKAMEGGHNIVDVNGPVTLEALGNSSSSSGSTAATAMLADGFNGTEKSGNEITSSGKVTLTAKGNQIAGGMSALNGGYNKIDANGEGGVHINAAGLSTGRATGLEAGGADSYNQIDSLNGVNVKAVGGLLTYGAVASDNAKNIIHAGEESTVKLTAEAQVMNSGATAGLFAAGGENSIAAMAGAGNMALVDISASDGLDNYGLQAQNAGTNRISGADAVKVSAIGGTYPGGPNGYNYAMSAQGDNAKNIIEAERVDILAEGGESAFGLHAVHGKNSIDTGDGDVSVTARGANFNYAVHAGSGGNNSIEAKDVTLRGSAEGVAYQYANAGGMNVISGGTNTITASGNVDIAVTGNWAAPGSNGMGSSSSRGMTAGEDNSKNLIKAGGRVSVTAEGGSAANLAMSASIHGRNEIADASSVLLTVRGAADGNTAMAATNGFAGGVAGSGNYIHDIAGEVRLSASGGRVTNHGMEASHAGKNSISDAGSVNISALGGALDNYGMRTLGNFSARFEDHMAENRISDIAGKVEITAEGGQNGYGMAATDLGRNIIDNAGSVEITARGSEKSYAMYTDHSGLAANTITNSNGSALTVIIKAEGGSLANYAMYGRYGTNQIIGGAGNDFISLKGDIYTEPGYDSYQKNIISTGAGNDRILLDGKVSGNFILDAGDGYDILVLHAANWDEFTARYETWLMNAAMGGMNIESIRYVVDNGEPMPSGYWLEGVAQGCGAEFGQAEFTDFAHLTGGDVAGYVTHEGDLTTTNTAGHSGQAVFGDADDYAHVKGHVENVDINLGDGHNTLHVDGHIKGDVSGGNDGNDVRAGGSFDGHMDLGSGADRVELGAMHSGTVNLGAGDDHLILHGFTGGTVDGGTGNDTLQLKLDGLGGNDAFAADGAFSGLFTQGAVQNFEELHFDMSGGSSDSLDVDGLVGSLRGLFSGQQLTVRISGDAGLDQVDTQALVDNGWSSQMDPNTGYTEWKNANSDENLILLIQNGLQ